MPDLSGTVVTFLGREHEVNVTLGIEREAPGHAEELVASRGKHLRRIGPGLPAVGAASVVDGVGRSTGTGGGILEALAPDQVYDAVGSCCNYGLGGWSIVLRHVDRFAPARVCGAEGIDLAGSRELLGSIHCMNGKILS